MKFQDKFVNLQKNCVMMMINYSKICRKIRFALCFLLLTSLFPVASFADENDGVQPKVECEYTDSSGVAQRVDAAFGSTVFCEAPVTVYCTGNLKYDTEKYVSCNCEWKIFDIAEGSSKPLVDRFTEDTDYTISTNGSFGVIFYYQLRDKSGNVYPYETDSAVIAIKESELECPDGFSPNGDGSNDVFRMTKFQSIVKLEGEIYNRWGQKLHTFTLDNIHQGWDGMYNGKVVKDGAYILRIYAIGSEGYEYNIRKVINVLKGYRTQSE